jgi:hypothetical protein
MNYIPSPPGERVRVMGIPNGKLFLREFLEKKLLRRQKNSE